MKNITLSIDDELLKISCKYVSLHQTTAPTSKNWPTDTFHLMDKAKKKSAKNPQWQWDRYDLYDV